MNDFHSQTHLSIAFHLHTMQFLCLRSLRTIYAFAHRGVNEKLLKHKHKQHFRVADDATNQEI